MSLNGDLDRAATQPDAPRPGATDALDVRIDRLEALVMRLEQTLAQREADLSAALADRDAEKTRRREAVRALDAAIDDLKLMAQE